LATYLDYLHVKTKGAVTNAVRDVRRPKVNNIEVHAIERPIMKDLLNGISNLRDKAMISLFVATGLRLEELRQLNRNGLSQKKRTLPDGTVRIVGVGNVTGKGDKPRRFLVDEKTLKLVVQYLRSRGTDGLTPLFISNRGARISRRNIQYVLDRWCKRLHLPRTHIHALRHTFATDASNSGMSALVLQELLGHSSLTVTRRYITVKPERQAREYFAVQEYLKATDPA
jgi:site-specific recombinase XerC